MNVCTVTTQLSLYTGVDNQTDEVPKDTGIGKCLLVNVCTYMYMYGDHDHCPEVGMEGRMEDGDGVYLYDDSSTDDSNVSIPGTAIANVHVHVPVQLMSHALYLYRVGSCSDAVNHTGP